MKKTLLLVALLIPAATQAAGQSSANYKIAAEVYGNLGAPTASASYKSNGTMGEAPVIGMDSSASYLGCHGYWCEAPLIVQIVYDLVMGDSDHDGYVMMNDASRALAALIDLGQCAYPTAAANGDGEMNIADVLYISQHATGVRSGSELIGPPGGPVSVNWYVGNLQSTGPGTPFADYLAVDASGTIASFCPNVAGIVVEYESVGGCADLRNTVTNQSGTIVLSQIVDEFTRVSEQIEATAGLVSGPCDVTATVRFVDPLGASLGQTQVTFSLTIN